MDKFFIAIPTPTLATNGVSLMKAIYAALFLGKEPSVTFSDSSTICAARTACLQNIRKLTDKKSERILWLDSDIIIMNEPNELRDILKEADDKDYNICGFYNLRDKRGSINDFGFKNIDSDAFKKMEQYSKVMFAGLGFYYGYTPIDYQFHESFNRGEDFNFYTENNITLRIDKRLVLGHVKAIII